MTFDHYISIQLKENASFSNKQCVNHLMREVHHFNQQEKNIEKVALSFPEYVLNGKLGNQFHIFGSFDALEKLFNQAGFAYLLGLKQCFVKTIRPVPKNNELGYCSFQRDQSHQKQTKKYVARSEVRAIKRAMMGKNTRLKSADDVLERRNRMLAKLQKSKTDLIDIQIDTASHESIFYLYVRAKRSDSPEINTPTSYGLSTLKQPLTLPLFLDSLI